MEPEPHHHRPPSVASNSSSRSAGSQFSNTSKNPDNKKVMDIRDLVDCNLEIYKQVCKIRSLNFLRMLLQRKRSSLWKANKPNTQVDKLFKKFPEAERDQFLEALETLYTTLTAWIQLDMSGLIEALELRSCSQEDMNALHQYRDENQVYYDLLLHMEPRGSGDAERFQPVQHDLKMTEFQLKIIKQSEWENGLASAERGRKLGAYKLEIEQIESKIEDRGKFQGLRQSNFLSNSERTSQFNRIWNDMDHEVFAALRDEMSKLKDFRGEVLKKYITMCLGYQKYVQNEVDEVRRECGEVGLFSVSKH